MFAIVIAGQFAARQEEKERALGVSNERFALAARGSNEGLFELESGDAGGVSPTSSRKSSACGIRTAAPTR